MHVQHFPENSDESYVLCVLMSLGWLEVGDVLSHCGVVGGLGMCGVSLGCVGNRGVVGGWG